jgi:hypothetical protein
MGVGRAHDELEAILSWFADRGFGISFTEDEERGGFWADLTRLPSGRLVAPRYGRGEGRAASALDARRRFEVEE